MAETMRTLILMRHAKSDWGSPDLPDHARHVNGRGQSDTLRMAQWMAEQALIPEIILASTAVRVRETVDSLRAHWSDPPPVCYSDDLYLAPPEAILRCVRGDAMDFTRVMVVGHNPGLAALVEKLAGQSLSMPTAAVAAFQLRIDNWRKLSTHSPVEAVTYHCPKSVGG